MDTVDDVTAWIRAVNTTNGYIIDITKLFLDIVIEVASDKTSPHRKRAIEAIHAASGLASEAITFLPGKLTSGDPA